MKKLGKRELAIISHLRQDARMKLTDLSRKTQTPVSTVFERIRKFRESGLVRLTTLLNFADLGFASRIMVAIKVDREIREEIEDYLARHPNINTVLHVNNGFSLVFEALFRNMKGSEDFIEDLDHRFKIRKKMVFYVLGEVKREAFLSNPATAEAIVTVKDGANK